MGYKPIRRNQGEGIAVIKMEDETGAVIENWTIMWSDLGKWVKQMHRKYGILRDNDRDLDWTR